MGVGVGIGLRTSNRFSSTGYVYLSETDTAAAAYVVAGYTLSATEKVALDVYIRAKQAAGIWTSTIVDYVFMGNIAASHAINIKSPGTKNLTFVNTVAGNHTSNGWTPNGTTSYGQTGVVPSTDLTLYAMGFEYYSRSNLVGGVEIGSLQTAATNLYQMRVDGLSSANPVLFDAGAAATGRLLGGTVTTSANSHIYVVTNSTTETVYINGVSEITSAAKVIGALLPNQQIYIGARNNAGVADAFDNKECAGCSIYTSNLTQANVTALYNARQALNTSLTRQV